MNIREWLKDQIDEACVKQATSKKIVKAEDGTETTETRELKRREFDFNRFLDIAGENGVSDEHVAEARGWLEVKNGPGRVRMTLGNRIFSAVATNGHLVVDGQEIGVPQDLLNEHRKAAAERKAERQSLKASAATAGAAA